MTHIERVFNEVREWALFVVKATSPVRAGVLADSFKLVTYPDGWGIQTDIHYMQYTEKKWGYHSGWKQTKVNPNEGWFTEVATLIAEEMARRLGGVVYVKYYN